MPFEAPILGRYWRIPTENVPRDRERLIEWLLECWQRIDGWIAERRTAPQAEAIETGDQQP